MDRCTDLDKRLVRALGPDHNVNIDGDAVTLTRDELSTLLDRFSLITHRGLAARFGWSEYHVRNLMRRDECPVAPVVVEGGDRAAVYPTGPAVKYLATHKLLTQAKRDG
ncbi:hypothetical protein [Streptomyces albidoflavus]|uniref:hypothetical protein n=1 Tax=Streptomyces albidoflavus TaxID=1886 RepID=UPI0033C852A3